MAYTSTQANLSHRGSYTQEYLRGAPEVLRQGLRHALFRDKNRKEHRAISANADSPDSKTAHARLKRSNLQPLRALHKELDMMRRG
jgi:hypothetical protein